MGVVHLLSQTVSELIAAGEVVERPASVLKELIENAIDAGATQITVEIQNGGLTFLKVTDNGCGFYPEDIPNAFLRHATSKIGSSSDLFSIATMGFRGEALASIAAVAKVELVSRREEADFGVRYEIHAGEEKTNETAGCAVGTAVTVRDLFFNTPARRKFLKKDVTESNAAYAVAEKLALVHPEISMRFIKDGQEKLHTPGDGKMFSAIYAVFGRDFAADLMPVSYAQNGMQITGFISKPHAARANRSMQNFYVNHRYVKTRICSIALEEAFRHELMVKKFPACVLNITLPFDAVDVNVHPAKTEVRFENEKEVFNLIYFGVKNALMQTDAAVAGTIRPETKKVQSPPFYGEKPDDAARTLTQKEHKVLYTWDTLGDKPGAAERFVQTEKNMAFLQDENSFLQFDYPNSHDRRKTELLDVERSPDLQEPGTIPPEMPKEQRSSQLSLENLHTTEQDSADSALLTETSANPDAFYGQLRFVGELFKTYIVLENEAEMVLVDKHAAHERILYNKLKSGRKDEFMQNLLMPVAVRLSWEEYSAGLEHLQELEKLGFLTEDFGEGTLLVRSAPMWIAGSDIENTLSEICTALLQNKQDVSPERLDWLYHNISCRSAIKGGDENTPEELSQVLKLMREDGEVFHCPHGRPVAVRLTRKEIEKQFGRI